MKKLCGIFIFYGGFAIASERILKCGDITNGTLCPGWLELYNTGYTEDGVYTIQPPGQTAVDTWCDMVGGGWTVVQRRQDGSEDFYRGWTDYQSSFGNRTGEYWLGLDNIHVLTSNQSEAFEDRNPESANLSFATFIFHGLSSKYKLSIAGYSSTCNNVAMYTGTEHGMKFTTKDKDNDVFVQKCAIIFKGAWWYQGCHHININGQYLNGTNGSLGQGVTYYPSWGLLTSLKKTTMRVRR